MRILQDDPAKALALRQVNKARVRDLGVDQPDLLHVRERPVAQAFQITVGDF
jgi:hypothetical protein